MLHTVTTVKPEIIREIVTWIQGHPDQTVDEYDSLVGGPRDTPGKIWARFIADPDTINQYENMDSDSMNGQHVHAGCDFIFTHGPCMGVGCRIEVVPGTTRCKFHNHAVFSKEIRDWIADERLKIDNLFTNEPMMNKRESSRCCVGYVRPHFKPKSEIDWDMFNKIPVSPPLSPPGLFPTVMMPTFPGISGSLPSTVPSMIPGISGSLPSPVTLPAGFSLPVFSESESSDSDSD